MLKTYRETKILTTVNCDMTGTWRLSDILETMQEVSIMHSELLGVGRNALFSKNLVWVLTRSEVVLERFPKTGDKIIIETFPMKTRRWLFPRYFLIYDENENIIGRISSLWVLMDYSERKIANPESAEPFLPDNSDLTAPLHFPGNIEDVDGSVLKIKQMPVYTDIDVNQHVNNTRYADWLCNALGINTMKKKVVGHLVIHYMHEILPGQEMDLTLYQNEDDFRMTGEHNGEKHFEIGGSLINKA